MAEGLLGLNEGHCGAPIFDWGAPSDDGKEPTPSRDARLEIQVVQTRVAGGRPSAPEEVWDRVRADYVAGVSAPECRRRHGVGLTALYARARQEGWRRNDLPWAPSRRLDPDDEGVALELSVEGDLDQIDHHDLSFIADQRRIRAILRGDAVGAQRWRRVRDDVKADERAMQRDFADDQAYFLSKAREREREAAEAAEAQAVLAEQTVDSVDAVGVFADRLVPDADQTVDAVDPVGVFIDRFATAGALDLQARRYALGAEGWSPEEIDELLQSNDPPPT